jgi:cytochrome d ubiquinol oxidase subunit I
MLLIAAPLQAVVGDFHGLNTREHQPVKIAAIEGHWENAGGAGVPLTLFAWPDAKHEMNRFALEVPHLGSVILTHNWDGQFRGLKEFPARDRPNVAVVFWSFRVMAGLGLLMIALGVWAGWARWRGLLYRSRGLLRCAVFMGPAGLIAMLAGWITTEVGRQPWVVYGLLRTADAVTPHSAAELGLSLVLFVLVYFTVFGTGIRYLLRLITVGPGAHDAKPVEGEPAQVRHALRPLSSAPDALGEQSGGESAPG